MSPLRKITNVPLKKLIPAFLFVVLVYASIIVILSNYLIFYKIYKKKIIKDINSINFIILESLKDMDIFETNLLYKYYNLVRENEYIEDILIIDSKNYILFSDKLSLIGQNLHQIENSNISFIKSFKENKKLILFYHRYASFTFLEEENLFQYDGYYFFYSELQNHFEIFILYRIDFLSMYSEYYYLFIINFILILTIPSGIFIVIYNKYYKKRIHQLLKVTNELSIGNFEHKIIVSGKDEIAFFSLLINQLVHSFYTLFFFDSLTEVLNRKGFEYKVNSILKKENVAILFLDLDGFKYINETFGHDVGDKALKIVALRIKTLASENLIGNQILIGRIGGDEFAICISSVSLINEDIFLDLQIFALKIIDEISKKIQVESYDFYLGASIGIAVSPRDGRTLSELLTNSDIAMYEAKYSSKNTYVFFNQQLKNKYVSKNILRNILYDIIKKQKLEDHFYFVYQPIYSIKENRITHLELLSRFYHPEIISGIQDVIQIMEELHFLPEYGNFMFKKGLKEFLEIKKQIGKELKLSINISIQQMLVKNFFRTYINIFESFNLSSSEIVFEITESLLMSHFEQVIRLMNSFIDYGFHFALDDFGTGYSSLLYLKKLPILYLKNDKSFVNIRDLQVNEVKTKNILKNILSIANSLELEIIQEGVENQMIYDTLVELNFTYAQGYFISPPKVQTEIIEVIKNNKIMQSENQKL